MIISYLPCWKPEPGFTPLTKVGEIRQRKIPIEAEQIHAFFDMERMNMMNIPTFI